MLENWKGYKDGMVRDSGICTVKQEERAKRGNVTNTSKRANRMEPGCALWCPVVGQRGMGTTDAWKVPSEHQEILFHYEGD